MFERFSSSARAVVVGAQEQARELRHAFIGTEHLLLALLVVDANGPAGRALRDAGVRKDAVRDEIVRQVGTGPGHLGEADADALQAIGIDLDAVRSKVEESFGPGALEEPDVECYRPSRSFVDRLRGRKRPQRVQRAPGTQIGPRHIPFTARAKKVMELALREALRLRSDYIGTEHLLLGLIREGRGLATQVLVDAGVDLQDLRRRLETEFRKAS
jgi:ATP-dependent Clp protease ATP-binding subunit ClpA